MMLRVVTSAVMLISFALSSGAEIIFEGLPETKVEAWSQGTQEYQLSASDRLQYRVAIMRRGGAYFWATRGGVELERRTSGIYDIFFAKSGAGYIKIEKSIVDGQPINYLEHHTLGLWTLTYFGSTTYFSSTYEYPR